MNLLKSINDNIITESEDLNAKVRAWADQVETRLGLESFDVWPTGPKTIRLNLLVIPKDKRKQGLGSQAMRELIDYADANGLRITLSPALSDDRKGTTSRARLVRFYKQFGFVENKGRRKDFSISDGMVRDPQ
jgi:GNAT superfamily N-acetyltransferase